MNWLRWMGRLLLKYSNRYSLKTLWVGYSSFSTWVSVIYMSLCPHPSHNAGGRISTIFGTLNSELFSLPSARATVSGFNSPSCDNVPSRRPFTFNPIPRYPFNCFSTNGCPSSKTRISSQASINCINCFLGSGYCPTFNTGYSQPSG